MSDNIPFELQVGIIKRVLPVKSLIRFRSVSKQWKSLIDSPEFIADHTVNPAQPQHLLVKYIVDSKEKHVSISDNDDSLPHHNSSLIVPPTIIDTIFSILDCSHGLVCLYGDFRGPVSRSKMTVLWNPSIRKSVGIVIPNEFVVLGFGVCPKTSDPKIVAIKNGNRIDSKAVVFTLSSGAWRSITTNLHLPLNSMHLSRKPVVIDGVIHWIAFDNLPRWIISFDLTSEEFGEVELPDSLAHAANLSISNFKGSLSVLIYKEAAVVCDVWTMIKTGDPMTRFTTASFKRESDRIIRFMKNGQMIREHICMRPRNFPVTTLEVYDSYSEHRNYLRVSGFFDPHIMKTSYTESLLLLNHSVSVIL
ncbi:putative F-box domain-containing protein [Helianthus anomalus]